MKKRCNSLCIIAISLIIPAVLALTAHADSIDIPDDIAYILVDSKTGLVIAEQDADSSLRPASTTKIMTAIIALEHGNLSQEMCVSQQAVYDIGKGGMNIGIMAGEEGLSLENMLNVLLIKSANECANIIAENLTESRSDFLRLMNEKAAELGALGTTFKNPSGKDTEKEDAGHLTTPRDLAAISRYAMAIPEFRKIVATEYYENMPATNKHDDWGLLRNSNQLLWYDSTYPYTLNGISRKYTVVGVKTGYTVEAGNNLVTAALGEDGMELISVIMHVTQPNKIYGYAKELLKYGFENYSMQHIAESGIPAGTITVEDTGQNYAVVTVVTESDLYSALPVDVNKDDIVSSLNIPRQIKAPVTKGDVLGNIEFRYGDTLLGRTNVIAAKSIAAEPLPVSAEYGIDCEESAEQPFSHTLYGILLFFSGFVILRMILRRISRKVNQKKMREKFTE